MAFKSHISAYIAFTLLLVLFAGDSYINAAQIDKANKALESSAEKLFETSSEQFKERNFWECSGNLILILDAYPEFSEIDHVIYMLGECLYESGMPEASRRIFEYFVSTQVDSKYMPSVLAAMQRIDFDQKDYEKSLEIHNALMNAKPEKEIAQYSLYYAGITRLHNHDYTGAIEYLSQIDESSPYWDNALYNLGLACLQTEQIRHAIDIFDHICKLPVFTPERQNLINETHLTLGYLYYEMEHYAQALNEFKQVSSEYENYQAVLLSSGWAATQMRDYKEAILHLTDFITLYPKSSDIPQGLFLLGRCYLKLGYYQEALQSYDYLIEILPQRGSLPDSMNMVHQFVAAQQEEIEKIKMDILMLESKFVNGLELELDRNAPEYIINEQNELVLQRQQILEQIHQERQILTTLNEKIVAILNLANTRDEQREWRAYAEYGKSRALYLCKQQNASLTLQQ